MSPMHVNNNPCMLGQIVGVKVNVMITNAGTTTLNLNDLMVCWDDHFAKPELI
jgi:hypothetical protein